MGFTATHLMKCAETALKTNEMISPNRCFFFPLFKRKSFNSTLLHYTARYSGCFSLCKCTIFLHVQSLHEIPKGTLSSSPELATPLIDHSHHPPLRPPSFPMKRPLESKCPFLPVGELTLPICM